MTKYYQLRDDMTLEGRCQVGEVFLPDGREVELDSGVPIQTNGSLLAHVTHAGNFTDFCVSSFGAPIATERLAAALSKEANGDMQCLPIRIPGLRNLMALNSVRIVSCLNEDRSEFLKWTENDHRADLVGQYRQVTKLVLQMDRIPGDANFFRIDGWLVALVVSESVKLVMQHAECSGAKFVALES